MRGRAVGLLLACLLAAGCSAGGAPEPVVASSAAAVEPTGTTASPSPGAGALAVPGAGRPGTLQPAPDAPPPPAWTGRAAAPIATSEVAGAAHAGALWTAGGFTADGAATTAVSTYDPASDRWAAGPDLPVAVHHSALVSTGAQLVLLGGYEGSDFTTPTAAVWVLEDGAWRAGEPLPAPRAAGAAAFDGSGIVYGGGVGPQLLAADVWRSAGEGWQPIGLLSTPREHLAAAGGEGVVWFMGGRSGGLDTNLGRVDLAAGGAVTGLGDLLPPAGGVTGFATPDGRGCMAGGEDPAVTSAVVVCVDRGGAVSRLPDMAVARHGLAAGVVDGVAYLAQGGPEPGLFTSDVLEALPLGG